MGRKKSGPEEFGTPENIDIQYRALFESTGTAMIVVDENVTISMSNQNMTEMTGFEETEILSRKLDDLIVADDLVKLVPKVMQLSKGDLREITKYNCRFYHKTGKVLDTLANLSGIPGTKKVLISFIDISNQKKIDRALKNSEQRYQELFEKATDIIYSHDIKGNFVSANKAALETYGYTAEEIMKLNIQKIIDPAYVPLALEKIGAKITGQCNDKPYELLTRRKNGELVWIEISSRPVWDGNTVVAIEGIARNITERKQTEQELSESRRRFKETADLLPGIICEIDNAFRLTYVNELGLKTFGFTMEDFEKGIYIDEIIPPDRKEQVEKDLKNIFDGDYGNPQVYRLYRKDKSLIDILINAAPIIHNGTIHGFRTCIIDISDRIRVEEKLRESEERFRSIYSKSPIGIALFSPQGYMIDMNESFRRIFGFSSENALTEQQINLFKTAKIGEEQRMELLAGGGITCEVVERSVSEEGYVESCFEWRITPLGMNKTGPAMFLTQVEDCTERKRQHEKRLRKEKEATAKAEALVVRLRRELTQKSTFHNMVSRSPRMIEIFSLLPEIAQASATVLITGESGTGKELIARSLHELGQRKNKNFVPINCSALPDTLLESELFGYKAGAFTDAKKDKPGKFSLAEGGTIFLDEIGDISMAMQVKLLRVLQERCYEALGSNSTIKANVRVIVATNKDLPVMVKSGEFREDLYYRINVVTVELPPLRERRSDIPLLCDHFIQKFSTRYDKAIDGIVPEALNYLIGYNFPGNIRELENIIEHTFIFCKSSTIQIEHLPPHLRMRDEMRSLKELANIKSFSELERMYIKSILAETGGNRIRAAKRLGIHKATLFRKMRQLGIH